MALSLDGAGLQRARRCPCWLHTPVQRWVRSFCSTSQHAERLSRHNTAMGTERKALPAVNATRCTGCGWCVAACPPHVLSLAVQQGKKHALVHDELGCTGCAQCVVRCPFDAIAMLRWPRYTQ